MVALDWIVVFAFLGGVVAVGAWVSRRASGGIEDFFVSGRNLPWWLAGTSILATSFSSDTPLHVTSVLRQRGLGGAWFYWNGILSGTLVAFFFARLWRRAGIVTDAEFIELRYSGKPASVLRASVALFRAVVLDLITLAWVIRGMSKVAATVLDLPAVVQLGPVQLPADGAVTVGLVLVALAYSVTSGLWGVVVTDFVEFIVAMLGAVLLAALAVHRVGGVGALREQLTSGPLGAGALDFVPSPSGTGLPAVALFVYVGLQWWANANIDGSGKRAQRFLACRSEGDALLAGLWNMSVQWLLRSWPWYLTALASLIIFPAVADHETVYPMMIAQLMPAGLKGLMVAAFLAAFLSTIDSHLNLAAAYFINDLYKRFVRKDASPRHYLTASRLAVVVLAAVATTLAMMLPSVLSALRFKMELMAGLGLVYALRWFWWRVTAWSEIAALITGPVTALTLNSTGLLDGLPPDAAFAWRLIIIVGSAAAAAVVTTLLAPPEPMDRLRAFYERVKPPALLWGPVAGDEPGADRLSAMAAQFGLAAVAIFSGMFAIGKLLLAEPGAGVGMALISGACWLMLRAALKATPLKRTT